MVRGRWWQNENFILPTCYGPKGNLNHMVIGSICCRNSQGDSNNDPRPAEVGKKFLLMLSSHLLTDTRDYSCSLILIQNFESIPQTHTHEDGDRRSRLRLTHTHFPKNSLLLTLIVVNTRQIGKKLMKKV